MTFLAMLPFLIVGGETIYGFALAMCWGIVIGAYSSIFVASPLQLILGVRRDAFSVSAAPAKGRGTAPARSLSPKAAKAGLAWMRPSEETR